MGNDCCPRTARPGTGTGCDAEPGRTCQRIEGVRKQSSKNVTIRDKTRHFLQLERAMSSFTHNRGSSLKAAISIKRGDSDILLRQLSTVWCRLLSDSSYCFGH